MNLPNPLPPLQQHRRCHRNPRVKDKDLSPRHTRPAVLVLLLLLAILHLPVAFAGGEEPQRIVLGITADPAHSQSVTWRSETLAKKPQAQVALAETGKDPDPDTAISVTATATDYVTGTGEHINGYTAILSPLTSGKKYAYRVGDGSTWSEWNQFQTPGEKPEPFTFLYVGDSQLRANANWAAIMRDAAFLLNPGARLLLQAGDLTNEGWDDSLWAEWYKGLGPYAARVPQVATPGNHDMNLPENAPGKPVSVFPLWHAHLALPDNGPTGAPMLKGEAYYFDYQGVRFISIEGNAYSEEQYDAEARAQVQSVQAPWLEKVLKENRNRWTIILQHEPMYGVGRNPDNPELRKAFLALYDQYHVDLVLQGHDHVYTRTPKLAGGQIVAPDAPGVVYVTSVSGTKMYAFNPKFQSLIAKTLENTPLYQVIEVGPDRLHFEARTAEGKNIDSFELLKTASGTSKLVTKQ